MDILKCSFCVFFLHRIKMKRHLNKNIIILSACCAGFVLWIIYQNNDPVQKNRQKKQQNVNVMNKIKEISDPKLKKYLMKPHGKLQNTVNTDKRYSQVKQDEVVYEILQKRMVFSLILVHTMANFCPTHSG